MAKLNILEFPDQRLRIKARRVEQVDGAVREVIDELFETMYEASGIGLAATQVDIHQRIIVLDVSEGKNSPLCLVNPEICSRSGVEESEEGCLSVPGFFETVKRADKITVRALDRKGESFELEADGLLAVCIQHEMDHLVGKLFVDYLSPLKRQMIRKKLVKSHRSTQTSAKDTKKVV